MNATEAATNWTLLGLLNWTTEYFRKLGVEDARLNAELLLSEATGLDRIMLYARFEEVASPGVIDRYRSMVKKRAQRCPLQYVLGYSEFYGRRFNVEPSVLIPRPETELLVERCLKLLPEGGGAVRTADIGTGSGVIAVTLAAERENLSCYATDISRKALDVAGANSRMHGVDERVVFLEGSLLDALPSGVKTGGEPLDLLASNLPYVPSKDIGGLSPEVGRWEPEGALDGGPEGLVLVRELVKSAADVLSSGGWLVLELGRGQARQVAAMIEGTAQWCAQSLNIIKDYGGNERILSAKKK